MRKLLLSTSLLLLAAVSLQAVPNAETSAMPAPEPDLLPAAVHPAPDAGSKLPAPWEYVASVPDGGGAYTRWSYNGSCASNGLLWMVGGRRDASWAVINNVGTYDKTSDTWDDAKPTLNQGRVYLCAAANKDYIFALGGRDPSGSVIYDNVERLESPSGTAWAVMSPLPAARVFGSAVISRGFLYYIGGTGDVGTKTTAIWRYDIAGDTVGGAPWDTTLAQLPTALSQMDAAVLNGRIYVPGDDITNTTYIYDISSGIWDSAGNGTMPAASQYKALAVGQYVLRIGGISGGVSTDSVWQFDPTTGSWAGFVHPMLQPRINFGGGLVGQHIVAAGGVAYPGFTPTLTAEAIDVGWMLPQLTATSPVDGATGSHVARPVTVSFSGPVDTLDWQYSWGPNPGPVSGSWSATMDTLTLTHSSLNYSTVYTIGIGCIDQGGNPLMPGLVPNPFSFSTWEAPEVIHDQLAVPGSAYASQIFGDYPTYTCYMADDIDIAGMDSVRITAVELMGGAWSGHTWHPMDSLYLCFTTDSSDFPAWSQEIWTGSLAAAAVDDAPYGDGISSTLFMYLDQPAVIKEGKTWMISAPYMDYAAKDGQWGWASNSVITGSSPAWRNPGDGFGNGTDWQRASSALGMPGDGIFRLLGYTYPTGVTGRPDQTVRAVFSLLPSFPNPAKEGTTFSFSLPEPGKYTLNIYNITGQLVRSFAGNGRAGTNHIKWNTATVGTGVYFYQLSSGGQGSTRKLVVLK